MASMPHLLLFLCCFVAFLAPASAQQAGASAESYHITDLLSRDLGILAACLFAAFLSYNLFCKWIDRARIASAADDSLRSKRSHPNPLWAALDRHLFSAPIFHRRRSRLLTVGKHLSLGFLPTRFETICIFLYVAINVIFLVVDLGWNVQTSVVLALEFRNRAGTLAVLNLLPLIVFAGRNNPLIVLLGIDFATYNLMHRWIGRIAVVEALMHGLAEVVYVVDLTPNGAATFRNLLATLDLFQAGMVALCALFTISLFAWSPIRSKFYEFFIHFHQILAIVAFGAVWRHLEVAGVWQKSLIISVVALWAADRTARLTRLMFWNFNPFGARKVTRCDLQVLPAGAVRVTVHLVRPWKARPGQSAYLYIPSIGLHTSHPFSVAWTGHTNSAGTTSSGSSAKLSLDSGRTSKESLGSEPDSLREASLAVALCTASSDDSDCLTFVVRKRDGFTSKLHALALESNDGSMVNMMAFVEGPYDHQSLSSYDTVVLVAGGVGITHPLSVVRQILKQRPLAKCATRQIFLEWAVQSSDQANWARAELLKLRQMDKHNMLHITVHMSRPDGSKVESISGSNMVYRKLDVQSTIDEILAQSEGATVVSVCGPGSLSDDVRHASRKWMARKNVSFIESSFMW